MYIILQLCCFDCNQFIDLYLCHDNDYFGFIINNIEDCSFCCFIIYDTNLNEITRLVFN